MVDRRIKIIIVLLIGVCFSATLLFAWPWSKKSAPPSKKQAAVMPSPDEVDVTEWNKKMFTERIDPATVGGDKEALAHAYHQKAVALLNKYYKDGDLKDLYTALNCTGEAIMLNPDKAIYWATLGDTHTEMSRFKIFGAQANAIHSYKQALKLDPDDAPVMMLLGVQLAKLAEYKEALDYFEKGLEKAPHLMSSNIAQWMNVCYLGGAQTKRGTIFYEDFMKANPEYYYLRIYKVILYESHFDYGSAELELNKVIADSKADRDTKKFASSMLKNIQNKEVAE